MARTKEEILEPYYHQNKNGLEEWIEYSDVLYAMEVYHQEKLREELPIEVIEKLFLIRNALIERDIHEAYHQLYLINDPEMEKTSDEIWKDWENIVEMELKRKSK